MEKIAISVVVLTKNEEANIENCLDSVLGWADQIIVIDDESSDKTVELAEKFTKDIFRRKMEVEGIHRNWAYAQARNNWVLSLDADETTTEELKEEISKVLKDASAKFVSYSIPLRNFIGDYWVRHSGWYPAGKVRLFRKDKFRYEEVKVHPRVFIDGECGHLTKDIIHKGYPDFAHFLSSVNNQSTLEAEKWIDTGRIMTPAHALRRTVDRFFRSFIGKKGFKDGFVGFMIAYFASLYQVLSYAKYRQMKLEIKKSPDK